MKWEYITAEARQAKMEKELYDTLNEWGAKGWELVTVTDKRFKREGEKRDSLNFVVRQGDERFHPWS